MNRRRSAEIALLTGALVWPARAQARTWRIGYLGAGVRPGAARPDPNLEAFLRGMRELG